MDQGQLGSVTPPEQVFERLQTTPEDQVLRTGSAMHIFTGKIDIAPEGGMRLWFKDLPYPKKGFAYPQGLWAANIVKRTTVMMMLSLARKEIVLPALGFMLSPFKWKIGLIENFLVQYFRNLDYILSPHYLKEPYMSPVSSEIHKFGRRFLNQLGVTLEVADRAVRIFAMLIELDDTYRYRIEDMMSEVTKEELMKNPRAGLKKIIGIVKAREEQVGEKFIAAANILIYATLHPKIKKAFRSALEASEFNRFQLDEADRYHVLCRAGYNFFGKSITERLNLYEEFHTESACCKAKVKIYKDMNNETTSAECLQCGKSCGIFTQYPPMVEYNVQQ